MKGDFNTYNYIKNFTETFQKFETVDINLREAACIEVMSHYEFKEIEQEDLLAGRKRMLPVGFLSEPLHGRSVGFFYDKEVTEEYLKDEKASIEEIEEIRDMLRFWENNETRHLLRKRYPEEIKKHMPEDIYWENAQVAFPLYRIIGAFLDYRLLLEKGISGLKEMIRIRLIKAETENESGNFLNACLMVLDTLQNLVLRYKDDAEEKGKNELAGILKAIAERAPETFPEAMQLAWIYSLISGVLNYGRMDDYLGDYLEKDLKEGRITRQKALDYVCSLWRLIDARKTVFHGRVIIGGRGRHNEKAADIFALLAIEASGIVSEAEPQLSLRFYEGQNPELFDQALRVIGEGKIYPLLYNDDVNIPSVKEAFCVSEEEAENYCFFGCGEYVIGQKSMGSPNGIINLLKALEITIFNGRDLTAHKRMGICTGEFENFENFEDFYFAYQNQLEFWLHLLIVQEQMEYDICRETGAFLYQSMLMDDCIERNRALLNGGVHYLGGTLETYGNINTANSLYAIKDLVFDKKLISAGRLKEALEANFEGYENERKLLKEAEKYGNDLDGVDSFAAKFHEWICSTVRSLASESSLHSYMVVIINNEANTVLGRFTGASADGRLSQEPMANANNPAGGTDINGVTAMLNSLVKLRTDIHAGAVQNLTFSKEMFTGNRELAKAVLLAYFRNGGQQAMINVLNRGDLQRAMEHPEEYSNLMVRVGGFSARFITLSPDVQKEIASRTLY